MSRHRVECEGMREDRRVPASAGATCGLGRDLYVVQTTLSAPWKMSKASLSRCPARKSVCASGAYQCRVAQIDERGVVHTAGDVRLIDERDEGVVHGGGKRQSAIGPRNHRLFSAAGIVDVEPTG